ncbi:IncF plasmid conjugative transfer pilus assembly protein TraB [Desulfurella amilsii]|uniref:IncF plasmid conjugative transfer pilus assembly protein TraB n=1 Tax=Desulfurella amilsii TaxID=1562698 RepID=A0A1X4XZD1_9BACT|nr:TraB/VirB10 family protein [Desulfurella amilsii]OSS42878.1 IncF plasmid conjugative transfer pilus assembly protein TraB [Desulfurella amilsii]
MEENKNQESNISGGVINKGTKDEKQTNSKNPLNNLPPNFKNKIFILMAVVLVFLFFTIKGILSNNSKKVHQKTNSTNSTLQLNNSVLLQKQLDQKISQIANATANNTQSIQQLKDIVKQQQSQQAQLPAPPSLPSNPNPIQQSAPPSLPPQNNNVSMPAPTPPPPPPARIQSINVNATQSNTTANQQSKNDDNYVTLPDGSIVSVTLVSGIYAPITSGQELPTLLNVNEMFYGPNHTRIPLKSCKVLAKAQGNQASERAFVNAYELSCVLPNGKSENFKISGYLSAQKDSAYGIKGKVISVTGKYLTGSFLSGVLQGFGSAMSMANQNSSLTTSGTVETSVNGGQVGKYSGYAGLAGGANALSQYYANKLNNLVDMIYVPAGTKAYLVVEKGAVITGYKLNNINQYGFRGVD